MAESLGSDNLAGVVSRLELFFYNASVMLVNNKLVCLPAVMFL